MKSDNLLFSIMAALIIGALQLLVLIYFWAGMTLYVQHIPWLMTLGVTGTTLHVLVFSFDTLANLVLCLPAAFALCALRPQRLGLYLVLAVGPGFLWGHRLMLTETSWLDHWPMFVPGAISAALTLPVAVLIARYLANRRAA